jgi:DNA repair exonuclease SbcCD ATPase subunit
MKITLKKLVLDKFRGITGTFEFNDKRNVFSGPNGSGKTTLFDAFVWLRTGKDSQGKADFDIKTIENGQEISKAEHSVNAVFEIEGNEIEIGRVYFEKWSKKRGEVEATKDGNKTNYFWDGVEVNKKTFDQKFINSHGVNFGLVSDINYLIELPWKQRRDLLTSLAPEIDLEAIIDSIDGFRDLLKGREVDQAKQLAEQREKKIKKELVTLNATIKANQDISGTGDIDQAEKEIEIAKADVEKCQAEIDKFKQGDTGKIEELKKLNDQLFTEEEKFSAEQFKAKNEVKNRSREIDAILDSIHHLELDIFDHGEKLTGLGQEWKVIKSKTPDDLKTVCGECGQELPQAAIERNLKNFNLDKSKALEENKVDGEKCAEQLRTAKANLDQLKKDKAELEKVKEPAILSLSSNVKIEGLKQKIKALKEAGTVEEVPELLQTNLFNAQGSLETAQQNKANLNAVSGAKKKLDDAKEQKKEISSEIDRIQAFLSMHEEYTKLSAEAVEKPVNDLFSLAKFRMFETLEKGNQVQCCEVMDKENRPYNTALSNGEKIRVGLDIVSTLQEKLDVSTVVFIDNSESVTGTIDLDCQYVELRANENFETLTKEV